MFDVNLATADPSFFALIHRSAWKENSPKFAPGNNYMVDAGDGVIVSTSVFEHKDAEEQSNFRAGEFVSEHLAPLLPNPPQITAGEVEASKAG